VKGMEVVDSIGAVEISPPGDGKPKQDVVMSKVTISK